MRRILPCNESSAMKMEATHFSKTLVTVYQTIQCHIPEDSNLQSYGCNIKISDAEILATNII
jgi:hypothetical protein